MLILYKLILLQSAIKLILCSAFCEDPNYIPENGTRSPLLQTHKYFFNGAKLRYYCNEGFKLNPPGYEQVCTANSSLQLSWQPETLPKCIQVMCEPPPEFEHSTNSNQDYARRTGFVGPIGALYQQFFNPGTKMYYYCLAGYYMDPGPPFSDDSLYPALTCRAGGKWEGDSFACVRKCGHLPPFDGVLIPKMTDVLYPHGFTVEYRCSDGTLPHGGDAFRTCTNDGTWNGTEPTCKTSTTILPNNSSMTCSRPTFQSEHLHWICCASTEDTDPGACCPSGAHIQFLCDEGYIMESQLPQLMCYRGLWSLFPPPKFKRITQNDIPRCIKQDNIPETPQKLFSHDMMGAVVATAIAVLLVLLIAAFLTFRPKLRDIKRRWLEKKKQDEVIINGQRIQLPTYEEAVSSQPYQVLCNSVSCESLQGSPSDDIAQNIVNDDVFQQNNEIIVTAGPELSSQIVINNHDSSNIDNDALCDIMPTSSSRSVIQIRDTNVSEALNNLSSFPLTGNPMSQQNNMQVIVEQSNVEDTISINSGTSLLNSTDDDVLMTSLFPLRNQQNADSTTVV